MATDVRCFDGGQWFSLTGPQGLRGPKGEDGLNQLTLGTLCSLPAGTMFKSNGTNVAAAVAGTDYLTPSNLGVLSIATGGAPSTGPADTIQLYSSDLSVGNTMLSLFTEGTCVNSNSTAAATHRVAVRINGTVYYLLANTAA